MHATNRLDWIIDQMDLTYEVSDLSEPPRAEVLAAAKELVGSEGFEELPDTNQRAEQSNWLGTLFDAAVRKAGGQIATAQKDSAPPVGGQWEGEASEAAPPPGFPGRFR